MMKILIATTNPAKIDRYTKYFKNINPGIEIFTLLDLNFKFTEPVETGANELENSKVKAEYYLDQTRFEGIVFAEDTGMSLLGVNPEDNPGKDIKKPVIEKYGDLDPINMVNYYSELASKYGGKIAQKWTYGFTLASKKLIKSAQTSSTSYLVSEIKQPIDEGHPLGSICLVDESNLKYWNQMNEDEKFDFFDKNTIILIKDLLTHFTN